MQSGAVENQVSIEWEWFDMFFFLIIPNLYSRLVHHGEPPATESYWIVGFHTELCATSQPSFPGTVGGPHFFWIPTLSTLFLGTSWHLTNGVSKCYWVRSWWECCCHIGPRSKFFARVNWSRGTLRQGHCSLQRLGKQPAKLPEFNMYSIRIHIIIIILYICIIFKNHNYHLSRQPFHPDISMKLVRIPQARDDGYRNGIWASCAAIPHCWNIPCWHWHHAACSTADVFASGIP